MEHIAFDASEQDDHPEEVDEEIVLVHRPKCHGRESMMNHSSESTRKHWVHTQTKLGNKVVCCFRMDSSSRACQLWTSQVDVHWQKSSCYDSVCKKCVQKDQMERRGDGGSSGTDFIVYNRLWSVTVKGVGTNAREHRGVVNRSRLQ